MNLKNKLVEELKEGTNFEKSLLIYLVDVLVKILKKWHIHDLIVLFNEEK